MQWHVACGECVEGVSPLTRGVWGTSPRKILVMYILGGAFWWILSIFWAVLSHFTDLQTENFWIHYIISVFLLGLVLFRSIVLNINILSGHFDFYQDITIEMTADNVENYQTLS